MKKLIALALAVLMIAACFAGCGNKKSTDGTPTEPQKVITVGYTIYAPMNYLDEENNNELIGFDTDLAKAVFGNLGYKVLFQEIDWNQRYTDLASGTIDCIWNGFTANTADSDGVLRSEKVAFSYNYMENRQVIVVKKGAAIQSAADLSGKVAAVESGSAGQTYAEGFEGVMVKGCLKQTECLLELVSEAVDVAVVDAQLAKSYVGNGDFADLEVVDSLSSDVEFYAIGFEKGSELVTQVNAQLEALAADGTLAALGEKYGVATTVVTDFSDQK